MHPRPGHGAGLTVDVQAALLDYLATRTVLLLPTSAAPAPLKDLNPTFDIGGEAYVLATQAIAAVLSRDLGKPVASLADQQDAIARALDLLLMGY